MLGLVQRAEAGGHYEDDAEATAAMAADERVHALVVAGPAQQQRARASGWFRAAVFGANDGLVSNFSLVAGMAGAGSSSQVILLAGLAGLLAGALSMAAGEYISVRSQRELLAAATHELDPATLAALRDQEADELALVFRARGLAPAQAQQQAAALLGEQDGDPAPVSSLDRAPAASSSARQVRAADLPALAGNDVMDRKDLGGHIRDAGLRQEGYQLLPEALERLLGLPHVHHPKPSGVGRPGGTRSPAQASRTAPGAAARC